jgi:hypothetical protein
MRRQAPRGLGLWGFGGLPAAGTHKSLITHNPELTAHVAVELRSEL